LTSSGNSALLTNVCSTAWPEPLMRARWCGSKTSIKA